MARLNDNGQIEIYDVSIDEFRRLTLEDVDQMERGCQAFGMWRQSQKSLTDAVLLVAQGRMSFSDFYKMTEDLRKSRIL